MGTDGNGCFVEGEGSRGITHEMARSAPQMELFAQWETCGTPFFLDH